MFRLTITDEQYGTRTVIYTNHAYISRDHLTYDDPDDPGEKVHRPVTSYYEVRIREMTEGELPPPPPPSLMDICIRPSCRHTRMTHHSGSGPCDVCADTIPCPGFTDDPAILQEG